MTAVPTQSRYDDTARAGALSGSRSGVRSDLASRGAGWDVLEARRGGLAERIACRDAVSRRHPVVVHLAATLVLWLLVVALLAAAGKLLTEVLVPIGVGGAEQDYNGWLEDQRAPFREDVSWVGSTLSGGHVIPLIVAVTCVVLALKRRWRLAGFFLTAILFELTAYRALVSLVPRERPDVERLESLPIQHSFPSGHVAATVAVYGALALVLAWYLKESRWRYAAYAVGIGMPLLVAASRMYRGMHNPTDALAGVLLGGLAVAASVFVARIVGVVVENRKRPRQAVT